MMYRDIHINMIYTCKCVYTYIYIYIYRERERAGEIWSCFDAEGSIRNVLQALGLFISTLK